MKAIIINSLVNGTQTVMVDDSDYPLVSCYKWHIYSCSIKGRRARTMYAVAHIEGKTIRMHRFILGVKDPKIIIDHKDSNGLNNCRDNLRLATSQQNQFNMRPFKKNKTGFKGVSYHKGDKKYMVFLKVGPKNTYFGSFDTPEAAAKQWNQVALQYHREFAYQNPV